jgi:hypothetical protein
VVAAAAVVVPLVAMIIMVAHDFDRNEKVSSVELASLVVAVLAFAITIVVEAGRASTPEPPATEETLAAAKSTLIALVAEQWRTEATLRSLGDPEPIPISWHLTDDVGLMDHPHLVGDRLLTFTASSDRLPELADSFRALRRRRLVITGGPGSGKTTLAVQLLLELAEGRDRRPEDPVPVLFTIADWDATAQLRLHDWLATRLARNYYALATPAYGREMARTLVERGHILPILDGLDELSEDARTAVIAALNGSLADSDQFILTSRTGELATAIEQAGDVLTAAAVIAPRPLTPQAAADYLRTCLPPGPPHGWAPVLDALENARLPGLAQVASTALGLWLIRTVYVTTTADPGPLTGPLADDPVVLRAHLFEHLIPATIRARTPTRDPVEHFRPRRAWDPDQARLHLAYLARLLTANGTRDLSWWHLARHTTTTRSQRRRTALTVGLVAGLVAWLVGWHADSPLYGASFGLLVGFLFGSAVGQWVSQTPGYADLRLRGRSTSLVKHEGTSWEHSRSRS